MELRSGAVFDFVYIHTSPNMSQVILRDPAGLILIVLVYIVWVNMFTHHSNYNKYLRFLSGSVSL